MDTLSSDKFHFFIFKNIQKQFPILILQNKKNKNIICFLKNKFVGNDIKLFDIMQTCLSKKNCLYYLAFHVIYIHIKKVALIIKDSKKYIETLNY